jgi:hypothetical protein
MIGTPTSNQTVKNSINIRVYTNVDNSITQLPPEHLLYSSFFKFGFTKAIKNAPE